MNQDKQKVLKEDFGLLIEAGFIAVKQLDETSASRIFHAAQVISPQSVAPQIGLGYIALNKLEIKEATKIFESVIKQEPDNNLAQVFLGICFLLTKPKRSKGEEIISEVLSKTTDPTIINLAKISLEWAEKDLKTGKTRFSFEDGSKKVEKGPAAVPAKPQ
ncbi:MAG: SctF chaperone SctG [Parachlamydiales bacterium]|jgi:hypothetical protein